MRLRADEELLRRRVKEAFVARVMAATSLRQIKAMEHYDFSRMGWQQFERMVQAVAQAELGNG